MRLSVIGTGSQGNCYALRSEEGILLLDAGVPVKKVLRALGADLANVLGVLVTHEHKDHAGHVAELMRLGVKCYTNRLTAEAIGIAEHPDFRDIDTSENERIGQFIVRSFSVQHDAVDPVGFLIHDKVTAENVLFATDTYYLKHTFPGVHYWLIECNHIRALMDAQAEDGELAESMRRRLITSHMSLERLLDAFGANDLTKTRKIVLIHLSDARSDEKQMVERIHKATGIDTVAARNGMEAELELCPF